MTEGGGGNELVADPLADDRGGFDGLEADEELVRSVFENVESFVSEFPAFELLEKRGEGRNSILFSGEDEERRGTDEEFGKSHEERKMCQIFEAFERAKEASRPIVRDLVKEIGAEAFVHGVDCRGQDQRLVSRR